MNDEIQTITFEESVQLRPGMYLGSTDSIGIINLISGLIKECIFIYKTDKLFFSIEFGGDGISFQINSDVDASVILQQLSDKHWKDKVYFRILSALAEHLEIVDGTKLSTSGVTINFQLNKAIFKDMSLDYQHLTEELILLALLNRGTEILIKDTTQKHINQNYFNFPNGIFYLYERIKKDNLGAPSFEIFYEGQMKEIKYQIALAYRNAWYPTPTVLSFANDTQTKNGGALVGGVLDGLILACRRYVKSNLLSNHKIKRKKFYNGLIMVCSVRGDNLLFEGSFKESIGTLEVRKQAKQIIYNLVYNYLNSDKDKAEKLLWRFDETQLGSNMF